MDTAQVPYEHRDFCAHLYIPFKECRVQHFFTHRNCEHQKHAWMLCQYKEFKRRVAIAIEEKRRRGMLTV
jgi:NADH dehydrogenase (ubiquinone) 1 beta subcomplex subunit 7